MDGFEEIYAIPGKGTPNNQTEVVLAFAGTGKSTAANICPEYIYDLPCMPFKYEGIDFDPYYPKELGEGEKATVSAESVIPGWEQAYADKVLELCQSGRYIYVLCPTDAGIAKALEERGIKYSVAYPDPTLKDEYERRFAERGNCQEFLDIFVGRWDGFMTTCKNLAEGKRTYLLEKGKYLANMLDFPVMIGSFEWVCIACDDEGNPPGVDLAREMLGLEPDDLLLFDWLIGSESISSIRVVRGGKDSDTDEVEEEDLDDAFSALDADIKRAFEDGALEVCAGFKGELEERQAAEEEERRYHDRAPVGRFLEGTIHIECDIGKYPPIDPVAKHFEDETGCGIDVRVNPPEHALEILGVYASGESHAWSEVPEKMRGAAEAYIEEKVWDVVPKLEKLRFHQRIDDCNLETLTPEK